MFKTAKRKLVEEAMVVVKEKDTLPVDCTQNTVTHIFVHLDSTMATCNSSVTISEISGFHHEAEVFSLLRVVWCMMVFGYQMPTFLVQHPRRAKTSSYGSL
jgi:hypothetical protein